MPENLPAFESCSDTLHIVLSTLPQKDHKKFISTIEEKFYKEFKTGRKNLNNKDGVDLSNSYKPLKYFLFGNYDIAFISMIDNYKFAQKPFCAVSNNDGAFVSYQTITGICPKINKGFDLPKFFKPKIIEGTYPYLCISNLKLNNKTLIGTGLPYYKKVLESINTVIQKYSDEADKKNGILKNYFVLQTFSWFEISLIVFAHDITKLSQILVDLRNLTITDIGYTDKTERENLLKDSLYQFIPNVNYAKLNPHVFADTQSHFGISYKFLNKKEKLNLIKSHELKTEIEWHVKPGHLSELLKELEKFTNSNNKKIFKTDANTVKLITGKSDYFIDEEIKDIDGKAKFFKQISSTNPEIFEYVRKLKTKIYFDNNEAEYIPSSNKNDSIIETNRFSEVLQKHINKDIENIFKTLKKIKISRQIQEKVVKIFHTYNSGISDSILFTYFLDFKSFITRFAQEIKDKGDEFDKLYSFTNNAIENEIKKEEVKSLIVAIEQDIENHVNEYEEGYRLRLLNAYNYEEISDFSIDFSSSVQQLLSMYSAIIYRTGCLFYKNYKGLIVQLNYKESVANRVAVNYTVYHLASPEFVFTTLVKEVLNNLPYDNKRGKEYIQLYNLIFEEAKKDLWLNNFVETQSIDLDYLLVDAARFFYTFNCDTQLFYHWFWSYNLQNTQLYDSMGSISEGHLKHELLRFTMLAHFCGFQNEAILFECPVPEIRIYWERHLQNIKKSAKNLFETDGCKESFTRLKILLGENTLTKATSKSLEGFNTSFDEIKKITKNDNHPSAAQSILVSKLMSYASGSNNNESKKPNTEPLYRCSLINHFAFTKIIPQLQKGNIVLYDTELYHNLDMFIASVMYAYLKLIAAGNSNQIHLLRRNWKTGDPLQSFAKVDAEKQIYYSLDQMGGQFFLNKKKADEYYRIKNAVLQTLWHCSLLIKKTYFENNGG